MQAMQSMITTGNWLDYLRSRRAFISNGGKQNQIARMIRSLPDEIQLSYGRYFNSTKEVSPHIKVLLRGEIFAQKTVVSPELIDSEVQQQPDVNFQKVTTVRSEITLKFNEIPVAEPAPNKKVKLTLSDEHENRFIVLLNAKSYKKATEGAASYARYAGNISGKLGKLTADGFEVLDAGIKIFEIKSQPQAQEQEPA